MKKMGKNLASLLAVLTLTTGAAGLTSCENVDLSQIIGDGLNITVTPNGAASESTGNNTTSESAKDSTESAGNNVTSESAKDSVTSESASESVSESEPVKELPEGVILHDGFYYKVNSPGESYENYNLVGIEKQLEKLTLPLTYNDKIVAQSIIMNEGFVETKGEVVVNTWNSVWAEEEPMTMDSFSECVESKTPKQICIGNSTQQRMLSLLGGNKVDVILQGSESGALLTVGGCENINIIIQDNCQDIQLVFIACNNMCVFYEGTSTDLIQIISVNLNENMEVVMKTFNAGESEAQRFENFYYYSETQPQTQGNYWHYVDGEPVIW